MWRFHVSFQVCDQIGLSHQSHGEGDQRYIVINKQKPTQTDTSLSSRISNHTATSEAEENAHGTTDKSKDSLLETATENGVEPENENSCKSPSIWEDKSAGSNLSSVSFGEMDENQVPVSVAGAADRLDTPTADSFLSPRTTEKHIFSDKHDS